MAPAALTVTTACLGAGKDALDAASGPAAARRALSTGSLAWSPGC